MSRRSRFLWASIVLGAVSACGTPPSPDVESIDVAPRDVVGRDVVRRDAGGMDAESLDDAGLDGSPSDATTPGDATSPTDGSSMDRVAPPMDGVAATDGALGDSGSSLPDVVGFEDSPRRLPFCDQPSALRMCATDAECDAPTQRCLPTGCGATRRCQTAGRGCRDGADCLSGAQTCVRGVCVATGADCGDSRACPPGYACEGSAGSRTCVSRRRVCDPSLAPCPFGGVCEGVPGVEPYCVAVTSRCASNTACRIGSTCRDVDGDGVNECVPGGPCSSDRCAPGDRCEILPIDYFLRCGPRGICNPATGCSPGYECVDVWASGVFECRPTAEPCRTNAVCPVNQLCFEAGGGGMPAAPAGCR
jgi:hypothetical protein